MGTTRHGSATRLESLPVITLITIFGTTAGFNLKPDCPFCKCWLRERRLGQQGKE